MKECFAGLKDRTRDRPHTRRKRIRSSYRARRELSGIYEYFLREFAPFNRNSITHSLTLVSNYPVNWKWKYSNRNTPGNIVRATKRYAKEILTRTPGHDLRDRKNVNKQVSAPVFLIF